MKLAQHARQHVRGFQIKIIVVSVEIGRHDRTVVRAVLPIVGLAELDPGNLGDRIRLVVRLQEAAQQMLLPHRLGAAARVDAGTAPKKQLLNSRPVSRMDYVALHHEVLVDEIGAVGVVGMFAAYFRSSQEHHIDLFTSEEILHRPLVDQVQFGVGTRDKVSIVLPFKLPQNCLADQAAVPGNVNARIFGKQEFVSHCHSEWP